MTKSCVICDSPFEKRDNESPNHFLFQRSTCGPECAKQRRRRMSHGFLDSPNTARARRKWDAS